MKQNLPLKQTQFFAPLLVTIICIALFVLLAENNNSLAFSHKDIAQGQWYRLFTGHFLHTNGWHLLLNLAGIWLLWGLHGDDYRTGAYLAMFGTLCLISALLIFYFSPQLQWYVGLSGVLHGIFAWGVVQDIKKKMLTGYVLLAGLIVKLANEHFYGAGDFMPELISAAVATSSHLYGALAGFAYALVALYFASKPHNQHA